VLGSTLPLLDLLWSLLLLAAVIAVVALVVICLVDKLGRSDRQGWAKAGWTALVLFVRLVGALTYLWRRPRGEEPARAGGGRGDGPARSLGYLEVEEMIVEIRRN
jgi:hypothetical protein